MPNGTWVVGEMAKHLVQKGFKWFYSAATSNRKGGKRYVCLIILWVKNLRTKETLKNLSFLYYNKQQKSLANAAQPIKDCNS